LVFLFIIFPVYLADPRATVEPEGLCLKKFPVTQTAVEPVTIPAGSELPQTTAPLLATLLDISQNLGPKAAVLSGWKRLALH
jgi:hypothetical protein